MLSKPVNHSTQCIQRRTCGRGYKPWYCPTRSMWLHLAAFFKFMLRNICAHFVGILLDALASCPDVWTNPLRRENFARMSDRRRANVWRTSGERLAYGRKMSGIRRAQCWVNVRLQFLDSGSVPEVVLRRTNRVPIGLLHDAWRQTVSSNTVCGRDRNTRSRSRRIVRTQSTYRFFCGFQKIDAK